MKSFKIYMAVLLLFLLFFIRCDNNLDVTSVKNAVDTLDQNHSSLVTSSANDAELQNNNQQKITIYDYFGTDHVYVYRKVNDAKLSIDDDSEKSHITTKYFLKFDCFFCKSSYFYNDKNNRAMIVAHSSPLHWSNRVGCSEKHVFTYPNEFKIVDQSKTKIIAIGSGSGSDNGCGKNFTFLTNETWIFTTEPIVVNMKVKAEQNYLSKAFNYPKTRTQNTGIPPYTKYLEIECKNNDFQVKPWVILERYYNGNLYNASGSKLLSIKKQHEDYFYNPENFSFGSIYNGTFVVRPVCYVISNSNVIQVVKFNKTYNVTIYGSDTKLPDSWLKNHLKLISINN